MPRSMRVQTIGHKKRLAKRNAERKRRVKAHGILLQGHSAREISTHTDVQRRCELIFLLGKVSLSIVSDGQVDRHNRQAQMAHCSPPVDPLRYALRRW